MFYVYSFLLILIFFILFKSIYSCRKSVPIKIKVLSLCALGVLAIRYIVLLVLFLINSIKYLYLLKSVYFLNFLVIPIIALIALYILGRSDKIKFNLVYLITGAMSIVYIIAMVISISSVVLTQFGYTIRIVHPMFFIYGYILLSIGLVAISAALLKKKHINKFGAYLTFFASIIGACELTLAVFGIRIFPQNIIGDVMWMLAFAFAIEQFEK